MISPTCQIHNFEEILKRLPERGHFVEVGAHDGYSYSNTWGLAEQGWTGIYIEPIANHAAQCRERHKNNKVHVLECACSNFNGEIELYAGNDIYSANGQMVSGNAIKVPCRTLDFLLDSNQEIDLLVIDVEFYEREVLEGFTLSKWKPKMVIIEAHEKHENEAYKLNVEFINNYFKSYQKIYSDGINNIYVNG